MNKYLKYNNKLTKINIAKNKKFDMFDMNKYFARKIKMSGGNLTIDSIQKNYTNNNQNIIGSGGNGLIVKHNNENKVIKLLYAKKCADAEKEYNIHIECYDNMNIFLNIIKQELQIKIDRAYSFCNSCDLEFNGEIYKCAYEMEFIESIVPLFINIDKTKDFNELIHITFNCEVPSKRRGRIYSEPISSNNPSRGVFVNEKDFDSYLDRIPLEIKKNILTKKDVLYRMGLLFGSCVFYAKYLPIDGEYVLSYDRTKNNLCVQILDFGMFEKINFPDVDIKKYVDAMIDKIEIDIYIPFYNNELFAHFFEGVMFSYENIPQVLMTEKDIECNKLIIENLQSYLE